MMALRCNDERCGAEKGVRCKAAQKSKHAFRAVPAGEPRLAQRPAGSGCGAVVLPVRWMDEFEP